MKKLKQINDNYWYYNVKDFVYNSEYINKYEGYANTEMGKTILEARLLILKNFDNLLDIGVGSGDLIYHKNRAKGFDVNPTMIKQLQKDNKWHDPYISDLSEFDVISFFDSFEHIQNPKILLNSIKQQTIVISIPMFYDYNSLLKSKHFRPDEHFHYFTFLGFLNYMNDLGFICYDISDIENQIGREDIFSWYRRFFQPVNIFK